MQRIRSILEQLVFIFVFRKYRITRCTGQLRYVDSNCFSWISLILIKSKNKKLEGTCWLWPVICEFSSRYCIPSETAGNWTSIVSNGREWWSSIRKCHNVNVRATLRNKCRISELTRSREHPAHLSQLAKSISIVHFLLHFRARASMLIDKIGCLSDALSIVSPLRETLLANLIVKRAFIYI